VTEPVRISLELPPDIVDQLVEKGHDVSRAALEALAIDAYRMERITGYQLGQLLGIPSPHDLDGFLKRHGVPLDYTIEDFELESAASAALRQTRQADLTANQVRERPPE
jgi:predicted HTH domain antitoxin